MSNNSEKLNKLTNDKIVKLGHKIAISELKTFLSSKGFTRKLFGDYTEKDSGGGHLPGSGNIDVLCAFFYDKHTKTTATTAVLENTAEANSNKTK